MESPSGLQVPPTKLPLGRGDSRVGGPPRTETLRISSPTEKATSWLSGDQKGRCAPSEPSMLRGFSESRGVDPESKLIFAGHIGDTPTVRSNDGIENFTARVEGELDVWDLGRFGRA